MKNMLRSTAAWINEKVASKRATAPVLVSLEKEPAHTPNLAPVPTPAAQPQVEFKAPVLPLTIPAVAVPEVAAPPVTAPPQFQDKLILSLKGSTFYATCPHCEATFNLQARLADPRFKRLFSTSGMTCAKCEKGVQMPTQEDLRLVKKV